VYGRLSIKYGRLFVKSLLRYGRPGIFVRILLLSFLGFAAAGISACTSTTTAARNTKAASEVKNDTAAKQQQEQSLSNEELNMEMLKLYNYGFGDYQREEWRDALPKLRKTNMLDKQLNGDKLRFPGIYSYIGQCYQNLNMPDSALFTFEEGLKHNPDHEFMNKSVVYYYKNSNQIDKYIPAVKKLISILKDPEEIKVNMLELKDVYVQRDQFDEAIAIYDKLLEKEPDNKDYIDARLSLFRSQGGEEAVRREYEEKHQQFPTDTEYIRELIIIYENASEYEKEIEMIDKLVALEPNDVESLEKKGHVLSSLGKNREAIEVLKGIARLVPDEPRYQTEIAHFYNDMQEYEQAVLYGNKALAINPGYGEAHFQIAMAFLNSANDAKDKRGNLKFEDKLVYKMAYEKFKQAARDINKKSEAEKWIKYIEASELLPTKENEFMHLSVKTPDLPEYRWLIKYYKQYFNIKNG